MMHDITWQLLKFDKAVSPLPHGLRGLNILEKIVAGGLDK